MRKTLLAGAMVGVCVAALPGKALPQEVPALPDSGQLPPAGFGALRQDDIALRIDSPSLQLRAFSLDERVIRLLLPDSYEALHRLKASREADVTRALNRNGLRQGSLFLVTFFGLRDRAVFAPEEVTIASQNRLFRPIDILPLSPLWSSLQLNQRETATAVYVFEDGIASLDPFTLSYAGVPNDQWERTLPTLDQERARVLSRAAAARSARP